MPLTWLLEHGGPAIRCRTMLDLAPEGSADPQNLVEALKATVLSDLVSAVTTRQQATGLWGGSFLAWQQSTRDNTDEPGTVAQYRRLLQLGVPTTTRPFRLADRVLFRTLSRDDDPLLYGEFFDATVDDPDAAEWYRNLIREGAAAALAEAGHEQDPRLRGAAHKVISAVSAFLRSDIVEDPLIPRGGSAWQLNPEATPPSWWSVAMLAAMPTLQRERAGFVERLGQYLAQPPITQSFMITVGSTTLRPAHLLLGDPIELDAKGVHKDVPLALHFTELLAGLGQLHASASAQAFLASLLADLDAEGVWHPKNLRSQPKAMSPVTHHYWPLAADDGELASRQADITFRLALIAKRLGWHLEYS
ncbi:MAG: hypothetical protein KC544_03965 [Gemmatimonadetes bacterium]|nr:hypothetical protein [Gemmatimonadota bacterium]MCA9762268.1 hypothetical protein [Gemmatimonadota bacterium]MCA9769060.1 hypothetical protein [Gemmatimonadota bacterium]MCB9505326.1 hypothetical protein [Gemmatimonadales bacterium]MCB9518034.1 hypothetical protein [Gemmatimonadales bacterium]